MTTRAMQLERLLGRILLAGVGISTTLLAIGLLLWMTTGPSGAGSTLLRAGLIVLMATPVMRVVVSFAEYVRQRDWFFSLITLAVLMELAVTLLVALRSG
ncbi:MAG: DUF1634 domain-containing protein [Acidobacteria bacterium]|nr:DUF1634 domain-containing protein [Acidobacteriota bacterium]